MIENRELALDLAKRWGNPEDVRFLMKCFSENKIKPEDKKKVQVFWDKRFTDAETLFWQGRVTLAFIKDDYSKLKLLQKHFGGKILTD